MSDPEITPQLLKTIDILEALEALMDDAPTPEIEQILQDAWLEVSDTFPEDFQEATQDDAGAEGLRRYIRVRAFFADPIANPISQADLEAYYQNHTEPDSDDLVE